MESTRLAGYCHPPRLPEQQAAAHGAPALHAAHLAILAADRRVEQEALAVWVGGPGPPCRWRGLGPRTMLRPCISIRGAKGAGERSDGRWLLRSGCSHCDAAWLR